MDVKNLRTGTALSERNDGSKYTQSGVALQCNKNKSYQDIGSNPLAKAEPIPVRPCAVIGPDRVVPPTTSNDPCLKKGPVESWLSPDNGYRRPPEYPIKISNQNPSRNISPRQTFQENMQRIMVPPTYNATRHSDDANFNHIQDRNIVTSKNVKTNMAPEAKYCDVPYSINTLPNEPNNVRDMDLYAPSANLPLTRTASNVWPQGGVNVHSPRTYGAHELYQYPQYPSCAGQRPTVIPITRPHRTIQEDAPFVYPEHYYQDAGARFKPYPPPPVKERYSQPRYEYIGNYPNQFHPPPPIQPLKYDMSKSGSSHPFTSYPHLKYLENRVPDHTLEGYQRPPTNQQPHYNPQFHNQVIHPNYAPVPGNSSQNKVHPYPPDMSDKTIASNKLHYDNSNKLYVEYENARTKTYPMTDNYYVNEISRVHQVKSQMVMPNYSPVGLHSIPSQQYYRKDNTQMKPFEYLPHFRNFEPHLNNSAMLRHTPQFSPNTLAISPSESSITNDPTQTHSTNQEDCGYVSQSSTASMRSIDSGIYRHPHEYYKRYGFRYGPIVENSHTLTKSDLNSNNVNSKENKKNINVRQFLQMWNEGEEENNCDNNNSKEIVIQTSSSDTSNLSKQHLSNQDQLYVLGLVNVPSEELSKYEHIQKISKLPENIKGYNNLELLNQFEEVIESSNTSTYKTISKEYQTTSQENSTRHVETIPRPLSPLDVEAKISQSVIHKEVGCNFEIRPCSPKMLNVEVAAPAHNILGERAIEKVTNPLSKIVKSPMPIKPDENSNCHKTQDSSFAMNDNPSCKMIKSPYATSNNNMNSVKTNYSLHDLEINSGVCLASLPRLDNEIELHFPEVNQQFINANKKDNNSITKTCSQSNIGIEESNLSDIKLVEGSEKDVVVEESEKTFTKLSKYRKVKANTADHSTNNHLTKTVRTDSVIIKNPENIKNIEDKLLENRFNTPINLSSQSSMSHDVPNTPENDIEIALDFSLSKSSNLPVIETEQEGSTKSFATHFSLSCENISPSDTSGSLNGSTKFDNQILDEKITNVNCIKADNQGSKIKMKTGTPIAMDTDIEVNATETLMSNNTCSDNLILEDHGLANKNPSIHFDTHQIVNSQNNEMSDSLKTCSDQKFISSKQHETYTVTTSIDNIFQKSNLSDSENHNNIILPHIENEPKYRDIQDPMQFICPQNVKGVHKKSNELIVTPQNNDDFEHDEISASLEKLFQESVEASVIVKSDDSYLDNKSMSLKSLRCQHGKELYSPWIQKLLTYSEGLCSNSKNEISQKEYVKKCIMNDDEDPKNIVSTNTDILKENHLQNMDIDHNSGPSSLDITISKEILIKEVTKNLTSDANCIKEACSDARNQTAFTVIDMIKDVNCSHHKNDIEDSQIMSANNLCVDKSLNELKADEKDKINVDFEKDDIDVHELNKLQDLQSINELLNGNLNISTEKSRDSKTKTYCETFTTSETCETFDSVNDVCNPENKIKVDLSTSNFKNQLLSINNTNSIEKKLKRKCSIDEVTLNRNSDQDDTLETCDSSNTWIQESKNTIDRNLHKRNSENNSDSAAHEIKEIHSSTTVVENHINDSNKYETSETLDSTTVVVQDYQNHLDLKNVSKDLSNDCNGQQTEENQDDVIIIGDSCIESDKNDNSTTFEIFKTYNINQENDNAVKHTVEHKSKENQDKEKIYINTAIEYHDNASDKFYSNNMVQEDHNNAVHKSLPQGVSVRCGDHQSKKDQSGENDADNVTEIFDSINNIKGHNNSGFKSLSSSISQGCDGYQIKKGEDTFIENKNEAEKNNTNSAKLSADAYCDVYQSKTNQDEKRTVEKEIFKNTNEVSKTSCSSSNIVQEDLMNPGLESCSTSGSDAYAKKENQTDEEDTDKVTNEYHDNDSNKTSEALRNSNIVQVHHNNTKNDHNNTDLERLFSVFSDSDGNQYKENKKGNRIVENYTQERHFYNTHEISKNNYSSDIVQEDHNSPSLERVSFNVFDVQHQTKVDDGSEDKMIENHDNTDTSPKIFYNSYIIQESHSSANLSENVIYGNQAGYETIEVQDGEKLIENCDDNMAKTLDTMNSSNICSTSLRTLKEAPNPENCKIHCIVFNSNTCLEQNNESKEVLSENVTSETSEELKNKTENNVVEEMQNIIVSESLSTNILRNNYCVEHHKDNIRSEESWFGEVSKQRDYTGDSSKPFDNSTIIQVDENNLRSKNISEHVLEICTEQKTNENKLIQIGMNENCNKNTSNSLEIIDGYNIERQYNNVINDAEKKISPKNKNSTEITSKSRDNIIGGTFNSRHIVPEFVDEVREDLNNPNLNSLCNSIFANNKTENNQSENEYLESETALKYTESNIAISFQRYDSQKSNCGSDCAVKKNTSMKETTIESNDIFDQCDTNTENIDHEKKENDQVHIETDVLNVVNQENTTHSSPRAKQRLCLKRSLSESALYSYKNRDTPDKQSMNNTPLIWPPKRAKMYELENSPHVNLLDENLCSFIHNNRRNSVSSFYNPENVSFCILIDDNCIITEENEDEKVCFAEISEDCIPEINTVNDEDNESEMICCSRDDELNFSNPVILDYGNEKSIQEAWLDDVACVETVVSDDIEEDIVIGASVSPTNIAISEYNDSAIFNSKIGDYNEINFINEETMPSSIYQIDKTCRSSPHADILNTLYDRESQDDELCKVFHFDNCLEKNLSESTNEIFSPSLANIIQTEVNNTKFLPDGTTNISECNKNILAKNITFQSYDKNVDQNYLNKEKNENNKYDYINKTGTSGCTSNEVVQSSKSSMDSLISYKKTEDSNYITPSSPEVSSTTFEEKNSSILLKITNYNGSRVSEVNEVNHSRQPRCKFTEEKEYSNPSGSFPKRPLITKAAQKYIPPLKESICDLKVKLALPQQRLLKLKQFKMSISQPKVMKQNNNALAIPKKPKPKPNFEDVLKNIDEVQIKMHKEKSKKGKNIIPKVVIKKNVNGSHYTSSLNKDTFNPDLTGRKWQPWVFLEKNRFIDNMAIKNKTKAIFSHRQNTYVLAEKFKKYKSVTNCSAKFVISQPKTGDSSRGQLKYTIKLKHTY